MSALHKHGGTNPSCGSTDSLVNVHIPYYIFGLSYLQFVFTLETVCRLAQIYWFLVMRQENMVSLLPCSNDSTRSIMKLEKLNVHFPSCATTDHTVVYLCFPLHSFIALHCNAMFLILRPIQELLSHLYLCVLVLRIFHLLTARAQMKLKLKYYLMKFKTTPAGALGQQYGERGIVQMIPAKFA